MDNPAMPMIFRAACRALCFTCSPLLTALIIVDHSDHSPLGPKEFCVVGIICICASFGWKD